MRVGIGVPIGTREHLPRVGSRRWWSSGLLLGGGAATLLGLLLPWGRGVGITVNSASPTMVIYTLALCVVGILAVVCGGFAITQPVASGWTKSGAIGGALLGIAAWLLLPAGITVAVQYRAGGALPTFETGAWILAAGVAALVTGAMLLCTRRRTSTLVALVLPLIAAVLMVIELQ